jgi:hypothetical protein
LPSRSLRIWRTAWGMKHSDLMTFGGRYNIPPKYILFNFIIFIIKTQTGNDVLETWTRLLSTSPKFSNTTSVLINSLEHSKMMEWVNAVHARSKMYSFYTCANTKLSIMYICTTNLNSHYVFLVSFSFGDDFWACWSKKPVIYKAFI